MYRIVTWAAVTVALLEFCIVNPVHAQTVAIRGDDWFPISGDGKRGQRGLMADIAELILIENQMSMDYRMQPWDAAVDAVREGKADCIVGALKTDAPDFVFPKQAWTVSQQTVYTNVDRPLSVNTIADLEGIKLGVSLDYSYGEALDTYIQDNLNRPSRIYAAPSTNRPLRALFSRLLTRQVDAVLETRVVAEANLRATGLQDRVRAAGSPVKESDLLYIACTPNSAKAQALVQTFDRGFGALRENGKLKEVYDRYQIDVP